MAFTTQIFTFVFLPVFLIISSVFDFIKRKNIFAGFFEKLRIADISLIALSFAFFAWACFDDVIFLFLYTLLVFVMGKIIHHFRSSGLSFTLTDNNGKIKKIYIAIIYFAVFVSIISFILLRFKYMGLVNKLWNIFFSDTWSTQSLMAPLGISFITFSAISYLSDIYKGLADSGSFIDCALYISFFPKIVSGPIVLWRDFKHQIKKRAMSIDGFTMGINRLMVGYAKKLILADTFGACIAKIPANSIDLITSWGMALLYMLQIYYDFSGYSDIAIGLANILGFDFKNNFNFPYLSTSITEFWRRWHISLGTWFREYIYFPLGGSRKGKKRTVINIAVVFILTGIWHGAGWTYMLWGALNGLCNIIEKLLAENKIYLITPKIIKWFLTFTVTFFSWEIFRFEGISQVIKQFKVMFGILSFESIPYTWQYYFDFRIIILALIGLIGATVFGLGKVKAPFEKFASTKIGLILKELVYILLFVTAILFMVNSSYSPFIYFQY